MVFGVGWFVMVFEVGWFGVGWVGEVRLVLLVRFWVRMGVREVVG